MKLVEWYVQEVTREQSKYIGVWRPTFVFYSIVEGKCLFFSSSEVVQKDEYWEIQVILKNGGRMYLRGYATSCAEVCNKYFGTNLDTSYTCEAGIGLYGRNGKPLCNNK